MDTFYNRTKTLCSSPYIIFAQYFPSNNYSILKYLPSTIFLKYELAWLHFYITSIYENRPIANS